MTHNKGAEVSRDMDSAHDKGDNSLGTSHIYTLDNL